jgi:putative DNA primase/helicase
MTIDFSAINSALLSDLLLHLREWLPNGRRMGGEYCVGSLAGEPGTSLKINIAKGVWRDFAGDTGGSDPVSLYAAIHRLTQGEAARRLSGAAPAAASAPKPEPEPEFYPVTDAEDLPDPGPLRADARWVYADEDGRVLGIIIRRDEHGRKTIMPRTPWYDGAGNIVWRWAQFAAPRPLYGLPGLRHAPEESVVVVEGEKCADALASVLPGVPVVSWPGGCNAHSQADWTPLSERNVILWPDADDPGRKAMQGIATTLEAMGCTVSLVQVPEGQPQGWDCADAVAEGWDGKRLRALLQGAQPSKPAVVAPVIVQQVVQVTDEEPERAELETWGFQRGAGGRYVVSLHALCTLLERHPRWAGKVWYDTFLDSMQTDAWGALEEWTDQHTGLLTRWVQAVLGLPQTTTAAVSEAVSMVAKSNRRNIVHAWVSGLEWDGVERLDDLFPVAFGTPRDEYHAAAGRCWMISLAARALSPGCKVDTMPVFEGGQGIGKSTALSILGGPWFGEGHEDIGSKDWVLSLRGKLLVEISELHSFRRADVDRLKGIMSTQVDRIRRPYARLPEDVPRACVFAGTTNRTDWQADETGARRFWPVACGGINLEWLRDCRTQLFAEAADLYRRGFRHWDIPHEDQRRLAAQRRPEDPWEEILDGALLTHRRYTTREILGQVLQIDVADQSQQQARRLGAVLRGLGWDLKDCRDSGSVRKMWVCCGA